MNNDDFETKVEVTEVKNEKRSILFVPPKDWDEGLLFCHSRKQTIRPVTNQPLHWSFEFRYRLRLKISQSSVLETVRTTTSDVCRQ